MILRSLFLGATLAAALTGQASAIPLTDLFNTGVDAAGVALGDNALDTHYAVIVAPDPTPLGQPLAATSAGGFPVGPWIGDSTVSAWISPKSDTNGPVGDYVFRTTFDLTGLDPLQTSIAGQWSIDNSAIGIYLNGGFVGQFNNSFTSFVPFAVTSGFVSGINTLDFAINNAGGPVGVRVEMTGTSQPVPEPSTYGLMIAGLLGAGAVARRRSK